MSEAVVGVAYETACRWSLRVVDLFEPEFDDHTTVAVDETEVAPADSVGHVRATGAADTFEVVRVEVSPGGRISTLSRPSNPDALPSLERVPKCCRDQPMFDVDRRQTDN